MSHEVNVLNASGPTNVYNDSINSTTHRITFDDLANDTLERFMPSIVFTGILMMIGLPGNLLVWYVYYSNWRKCTARIFILSLATLDLTNCLITLPLEIVLMNFLNFDYPGICKLFRFITYTMNSSSALVLVAIAIDRYDRICRPHQLHLTPWRTKVVCVISVVVSVLIMWPSLILYGIQTINVQNITIKICLIEEAYIGTPYPLAYFTSISFLTLVNFIVLCVLYCIIGIHIWRVWRLRSTSSKRTGSEKFSREESSEYIDGDTKMDGVGRRSRLNSNKAKLVYPSIAKIVDGVSNRLTRVRKFTFSNTGARKVSKNTLMLFVITLIYIVSFLPFLILVTIRSLHSDFMTSHSKSADMALQVILRSYLINSAVNPIIYSFCNEQFRIKCKQVFSSMLRCKKRV